MIKEQKIAGRAILIGGQPGTGKTALAYVYIYHILNLIYLILLICYSKNFSIKYTIYLYIYI